MASPTTDIPCYICYGNSDSDSESPWAENPCDCRGTMRVHTQCLEILRQRNNTCKVCGSLYYAKPYTAEQLENGYLTKKTFVEGKLHGPWTAYFSDGTMYQERVYNKGQIHGPYKEYWWNGQLRYDITYKHNFQEGIIRAFHKSGSRDFESHVSKSRRHGQTQYFFEDSGARRIDCHYENGQSVGTSMFYYADGGLKMTIHHDRVRRIETWTYYDGHDGITNRFERPLTDMIY